MKPKLFETLRLKFEKADWANNPEFGLLDTILDQHPELLKLVEPDVVKGCKQSDLGRQDMPSVEQIMRAAIYKEIRGLDYRELEYHQIDSRICELYVYRIIYILIMRPHRGRMNEIDIHCYKYTIPSGLISDAS